MEPKVTGLSPMTGPPGTKITVRGENLGQSAEDVIELTVNEADCLPYLDWKSPKKIITRCTRAIGSGAIILVTKSGGVGTCDVQFNCHEETVGPTEESAVWVEELDYQVSEKQKLTSEPISHERYSVELSSDQFRPEMFLIHKYPEANLHELSIRESELKRKEKIADKFSQNPIITDLLKSNLPVILECLNKSERLSKTIANYSIEGIVEQSLSRTSKLFGPLLEQQELVQSIETILQNFRQNENLFSLPSEIENSIRSKNYDLVVNKISSVLSRLETIYIDKKIQLNVTTKVEELKKAIENQIRESCQRTDGERNIDEVKKLISYLNRLGHYDVIVAIETIYNSLIETLTKKYYYFLDLSKKNKTSKPPYVVQFVQCALSIFQNSYYDLLQLGQSYFEEIKYSYMVSEPIVHLCSLLRSALVPESPELDLDKSPQPWPAAETDSSEYVDWLNEVLQSVINVQKQLTSVAGATDAINAFKDFVSELRIRSMKILFHNATSVNKKLHIEEDWELEVEGTTQLPLIFERNVVNTLKCANEIIKTHCPDEQSILKQVNVQAIFKELAQPLINSFIDSLENALLDNRVSPSESTRPLFATKISGRVLSKYDNRLLITICNCHYTKKRVFVRLQDEFEKLQGLKMDRVFAACSKKYSSYIDKLKGKFSRIITDRLNRSQVDDLQLELMMINSQIFLIAPQLVNELMTAIVNKLNSER